jgi:hypothetical protein
MKQAFEVLNRMETEGLIGRYAVSGAIAALKYLEPSVTRDLDILVALIPKSGLINLTPIFDYLRAQGLETHEGEGIVIGGWPVQFIPVSDDLDAEALAQAEETEIDFPDDGSVRTRMLRPEHLVAIALRTDRPKDRARVAEFLESGVLDIPKFCGLLERFSLMYKWNTFCGSMQIPNPCRRPPT